jgi:16S rRNA (adenine1518-N6/adenine1519-N6)-dimethyltransferase
VNGPAITDDGLPPLREVIAALGLNAKKSLGQNFLLDMNLTRRIARAAEAKDAVIYEVGPGPGGLTRALLAEGASRVVAVERDSRCIPALEQIAAAWPGKLDTIEADAMTVDEAALFHDLGVSGPVRVAANLPYNAGTALLVKWLESEIWPPFWASLTLMFQREVAERIVARPRSKAYGRLSVLAQWRAKAHILFDIGPRAFVPPPKVTSSLLRIDPLAQPVAEARLADLQRVCAAAFGQRRKMLRQSLKAITPDAEGLINRAGLDPTARAETLSIADFAALARVSAPRS